MRTIVGRTLNGKQNVTGKKILISCYFIDNGIGLIVQAKNVILKIIALIKDYQYDMIIQSLVD